MDNLITVAARKNDPNYAQFSVYLPRQLVKELKVIAAQDEVTLTDIAEEALTQWVKDRKSQGSQGDSSVTDTSNSSKEAK